MTSDRHNHSDTKQANCQIKYRLVHIIFHKWHKNAGAGAAEFDRGHAQRFTILVSLLGSEIDDVNELLSGGDATPTSDRARPHCLAAQKFCEFGMAGGRSEMEGFPIICCDVAEFRLAQAQRLLQDRIKHRPEVAGRELMTCNISAVAVCCSNASRVSVKSRAFSIAMTACAAKFCNSAICLSENGRTSRR